MRALALIQCFWRSTQGELSSPGHMHRSMQQTLKESEGLYALEVRLVQTICMLRDLLLLILFFFQQEPAGNLEQPQAHVQINA